MINRKIPWTSQPQYPVDIDQGNPLTKSLVAVISSINGTNLVNNVPVNGLSGAGVVPTPNNGLVADFIGKSSASKVTSKFLLTSPSSTTPGDRTYFIPFLRNGAGGGNYGRLFQKGSNECYLMEDVATNTFVFVQSTSGGGNLSSQRFIPAGGLSGTVGWHTLAVTMTAAGTVLMYLDGVSQGLTGSSYTNGATTQTSAFVLGNRSTDNARVWNGQLGNLSIFDRVLASDQIQQLINNQWEVFQPQNRRIWVAGTSSGSTGTVAVTNANDTSSASGTTTVTGSVAKSNANDTSAASGTTTITGSLARTNVNDTSAASGTPTVTGTLATTNANDTVSASGAVGNNVTGTSSTTNANDTSAASGTTTIVGTAARTNANDTSTASGTTTIVGTVAYTNANDTATASGVAGTVSGTVAYVNNNDIITASGSAGPVSEAGRLGGFEYGSKVYIKRNKKIYIFDSVEEADSYIEAESKVEEIVQQSNKTSRLARKRAREKAHKLLSIEPVESVDIPALKTLVSQLQTDFALPHWIAQQDWGKVVEIYHQAMEMQDEEDLLLIL